MTDSPFHPFQPAIEQASGSPSAQGQKGCPNYYYFLIITLYNPFAYPFTLIRYHVALVPSVRAKIIKGQPSPHTKLAFLFSVEKSLAYLVKIIDFPGDILYN
ncbi:hypothetical protein ACQCVO_06710 [Bacillus infantis]|uniref:hypothetical protein n=1 Tax=Bacillus infantis TaxID=324767 RepID=UPI003CEB8E70